MNQIYSYLRCIKALDIIRIKMVVSVVPAVHNIVRMVVSVVSAVHNIDIFFYEVKKLVVSFVAMSSRDFLLSCSEACPENGLQCSRVRQARSNMADLY